MKAECYIFLVNFLNAAVENIHDGQITKKVEIESDLWLEGKHVGKLNSTFVIEHLPYIRQKLAGVMTEDGHKKSAPVIMGKTSNPKIKELGTTLNELKELYYLHETKGSGGGKISPLNQIRLRLETLAHLLVQTDQATSRSFIYKTMDDMIKTQEVLLELGGLLHSANQKLDPASQQFYFAAMTALLKRGEFDLAALGFESGLGKKQVELKRKIGLDFQRFIYRLLDNVFDDLEQKGLGESERNFIEFLLSYAYFRIPEFRTELLNVLSDQSPAHRNLDNKEIESVLLDWGKDFYAHLASDQRYAVNMDLLSKALMKGWREKFKKKGIIFFYFIIQWCEYVVKTLVVKNFFWENIYGYEVLVSAFVEQLASKSVDKYSDILVRATKSLLANRNVLDIMVRTLISQTK